MSGSPARPRPGRVLDWSEDLSDARWRAIGMRRPFDASMLTRLGWRPGTYRRLEALAERAAECGAIVSRSPQGSATRELVAWAEGLSRSGLRLETIFAWLALLVEQTSEPGATLVRDQLNRLAGLPDEAWALRRWAPWVWAAGLDFTEALAALVADRLGEEGLRMLAGLRGIRLPAELC